MAGNHIWRNVAWPVPKKPCYCFMCEFSLPTKSWALIKSLWRPVWAPDCVKFRARKSSDDLLPAGSCLSGRKGRDEDHAGFLLPNLPSRWGFLLPAGKWVKGKATGQAFFPAKPLHMETWGGEECMYAFNILTSWRSEMHSDSLAIKSCVILWKVNKVTRNIINSYHIRSRNNFLQLM